MATTGVLRTLLVADTTPFAKGLKRGSAQLSSFTDSVASSTRRLLAWGAAAAAATIGIGSATAGFKAAAEYEQAQVALEVMTGSAQTANRVLEKLTRFAASTPFEFPELMQATKTLVAFGISADESVETLRRIGDIASGVGAPVGDLAFVFGQMRAQGRVMTQDMNQFASRGIPVWGGLAKQLGVTEAGVRKLVEQGKIGFPQINQLFIDLTDTGGQFAGMMAKQSTTLAGLWSTLKDNVGLAMRQMAEDIVKAFDVKQVIADLTTTIAAVGTVMAKVLRVSAAFVKLFGFAERSTLPFWLKFAAAVAAGAYVLNKIVTVSVRVVKALTAMAKAQASLLALSGPKGWLALGAGLVAAAAAAAAVEWGMSGIVKETEALAAEAEAASPELQNVVEQVDAITSAATDNTGAVDKLVASYREAIDTFGWSQHAIELYRLEQQGATHDDIWRVRVMQAQVEMLEQQAEATEKAAKAQRKLRDEANAVIESVKDPFEKLNDELVELQALLDKGLISDDVFDKAVQNLAKNMQHAIGKTNMELLTQAGVIPQGATFGEAGAMSAVERRFTSNTPNSDASNLQKKFVEMQIKQLRVEEQQRDILSRQERQSSRFQVVHF